jgi:hypothetical protein
VWPIAHIWDDPLVPTYATDSHKDFFDHIKFILIYTDNKDAKTLDMRHSNVAFATRCLIQTKISIFISF